MYVSPGLAAFPVQLNDGHVSSEGRTANFVTNENRMAVTGPRSTGNSTGGSGEWGGAVNPICRRVRSGTRFTLDNAIPTGHQSVLADLIPFGSTISVERYFIERPRSNSRFFSSFFASIFVRRRDSMCAQRYAVTLVNIEVRKEDVMAFVIAFVFVYFLVILSKGFSRFVHSIGILWNFERWVFESLVIIL